MKYSEARQGRALVIRLEDGDIIHEEIERFARIEAVRAAAMVIVGGADKGSKLMVGPEQDRSAPIVPMEHVLSNVNEIVGTEWASCRWISIAAKIGAPSRMIKSG